MDEINDFFDFSKPFNRITIPPGYVNGRIIQDENIVNKIVKREEVKDEYAKLYQEAERKQIFLSDAGPSTSRSYLNEMESFDEEHPKMRKLESTIYDKYVFKFNFDMDLPIADFQTKIVETIRKNPVVVLQGDTGCGKTTQVPQYILHDAYTRREYCNIICTQPRRIAAISIANRVCSERKWTTGSVVGYQVGLHTNSSDDTRLLYCTTGILLQKLIQMKDISTWTHIILDEVHERSQDMDFLLIIIRRLLITKSPHTKLILMSATINTKEFSEYFTLPINGAHVPAPVLNVDIRRIFSVKEFYLCQLEKLAVNIESIKFEEPGIDDEIYKTALKLVIICERLDNRSLHEEEITRKPSILIFLPGINEIDKMEKTMGSLSDITSEIKILPLRLHSMITADEQQRVFRPPPPGFRKVILATNIAESSITVPDVKYVIDFCLTKSLINDSNTNWSSLQLHWASRSNCKQRAGRAGRVMHGRVYRLVPKDFYFRQMEEMSQPELLRCPLENVVLKTKLLDMGPPHTILALAMNPPNLSDIRNTVLVLKELGALLKTTNGTYEDLDGDLTFIGRVMAALPVDVRISRLIIFGYMFSVLEETIIIGAGLNLKSIFDFPFNSLLQAYSQKLTWSDGSGSDLFAILKAYKVWSSAKEQKKFDDDATERAWARRYFINVRAMKEVHALALELKERLDRVGVKALTGPQGVKWLPNEQTIILKIVISGAFYPNYFVRSASSYQSYESDIYHAIGGRDPCNTVFLTGFDPKYIGVIYTQAIKDMFACCTTNMRNIQVAFDRGAQKIYVTFMDDEEAEYNDDKAPVQAIPGKVKTEVYKAIKMKKVRTDLQLKVLSQRDAVEYATALKLGVMKDGVWIPRKSTIKNRELLVVPGINIKTVRGQVTHIEHCDKFWFQPLSEEERMKEIVQDLNGLHSDICCFSNPSEVSKGLMVAAPFSDPGSQQKFFRARIIKPEPINNQIAFKVMFIDYGNFAVVEFARLRRLGQMTRTLKDIPPRVFQCRLAEIEPSSIKCPRGQWPEEAMEKMQTFVDRGVVELEIYSVIDGVASVILRQGGDSFNDYLVENKFAQVSEENYLSKENHDLRSRRQRIMEVTDEDVDGYDREDSIMNQDVLDNEKIKLPPPEKCRTTINLKGPFNPLESSVFACTRGGIWKSATIEQQSINSVFLDADPQDSHERYLVAASINETKGKSEITARQTTFLPNINGFGPIMGMIFAPTMELRRDKNKSKYISVLTGLGCDSNNKPLFEEHDLVFNLDVDISSNDLEMINQIRYTMDTLIYTRPGEEIAKLTFVERVELTTKIKHLIISLLEKQRKSIEIHMDSVSHKWCENQQHEDLLVTENIYSDRAIFPLHAGLRLYNEPFERLHSLQLHSAELHKLASFDISIRPTVCQLCEQTIETIVQLRIHLLSKLHRDREYQIGYTP